MPPWGRYRRAPQGVPWVSGRSPPTWEVQHTVGGRASLEYFKTNEGGREVLEGKGPQRPPQQRLDRRLEEVAKAVGCGYCRL